MGLVSLKYPLLRWVVVVYGGLGRGRGGGGFRLGVMARERDRHPWPVFQADPIEGIGGLRKAARSAGLSSGRGTG